MTQGKWEKVKGTTIHHENAYSKPPNTDPSSDRNVKDESAWTRIETRDGEFSISIPNDFSVLFDRNGTKVGNPRNRSERYELRDLRSIMYFL